MRWWRKDNSNVVVAVVLEGNKRNLVVVEEGKQ